MTIQHYKARGLITEDEITQLELTEKVMALVERLSGEYQKIQEAINTYQEFNNNRKKYGGEKTKIS